MRSIIIFLCMACCGPALGMDHATLRRDGKELQVDGRLVVEAQDGGLLMLGRDGVLWAIPPEEKLKHTSDEAPFKPFTADEFSKQLLAELPKGFDIHRTSHYLIFYDTSRAYAQWCGSLFERLYLAFTNYWGRKGFQLTEPEFPLVAIVFADRNAYLKFSRPELGDAGTSVIGYFSLTTNRMTMYDLTGTEMFSRLRSRASTAGQINQLLARPEALQTVATVVHEATHQIAFNCGLHTRLSDCPVWFSEGIAIYFETPDVSNAKGWRGVGNVNRPRLEQFHQYLRSRPQNSLETLIGGDKRFRNPQQALDAYAEAWALTYFLVRQHPDRYIAYLKMLSQKKALLQDGPEKRIEQFQQAFGSLKTLDAEFIRYLGRVR